MSLLDCPDVIRVRMSLLDVRFHSFHVCEMTLVELYIVMVRDFVSYVKLIYHDQIRQVQFLAIERSEILRMYGELLFSSPL